MGFEFDPPSPLRGFEIRVWVEEVDLTVGSPIFPARRDVGVGLLHGELVFPGGVRRRLTEAELDALYRHASGGGPLIRLG